MIKVNDRESEGCKPKDVATWAQRFAILIKRLSCTVGQIVRVGQWLHSIDGRKFYEECLGIVHDELGKSLKISRVAQSAACVLFAARKGSDLMFRCAVKFQKKKRTDYFTIGA